MKVYEKFRQDVKEVLKEKGTPCLVYHVAVGVIPKWATINTTNIIDTLRAAGFPVIGNSVYNIDE